MNDKLYILAALFLVFVIITALPIEVSSFAIANFNAPILTPSQAIYNEPWVGTIVYTYAYSTHTDEFNALLDGKVDFITLTHVSEIEELKTAPYNQTAFLAIAPQESFGQIAFAFGNNLTSNIYFRYAISSLINPENVTSYVLDNGVLGTDEPYFVNPSLQVYTQWFNPQAEAYYNQYESYNLTRAVMYLEKVPGVTHVNGQWYYNGKPLKLTFYYTYPPETLKRFAELLASSAAAINLSITPVSETFSALITQATTPPFNDFNMTTFGWINLGPFPNSWMNGIYTSPGNVGGFSNSTIDQVLQNALNAPTLAQEENYTKQADLLLQQQLPYVIYTWSNAIQAVYLPNWANYIYLASGTPEYAINIMDVHPTNQALNGTFIFSSISSDLPRHINIYASVSLYAFNTLDDMYDSLGISPLNNPTQVIPWVASSWQVQKQVTMTLPNGDKIVNGSIITVNLVHNDTWIDGVPLTAYDVNFTVWYYDLPGMMGTNTFDGVTLNYTFLSNEGFINTDLFGTIPSLVWTNVTNPYQIVFYLNSSSYVNEYLVLTEYPIMPAHAIAPVNVVTLYHSTLAPEISSGPYMFSSFNSEAKTVTVTYNPYYFRINPLIFMQNVTEGKSVNVTSEFQYYTWNNVTSSLVPNPVNGTAVMWLKYLNVSGEGYGNATSPVKMSMIAPGTYMGTINTTGLKPGIYEVVSKVMWDNGTRELFSYKSLNVTPSQVVTTTKPPTTTTTSSNTTLEIVAGVIIVIIIVAILVVVLRRR
ncbi:ABC transporter substrate-binding protein [Metallosphaera cuprina]|uniref:ABC-type dipeptide transport system periplasmic component-like protein n=1 Tax=Metallosphaera cuprina (strain Ar-4) TaxID=1006006 RepID=F4FZY7_METCR|nr:ABC transporter substrate-binding protein [Metallosphaera cuprina]AEB95749.1 ABC-type dipeptide transport system periplasmic component-like protein [Metallosphaera cuprina Ar-4]